MSQPELLPELSASLQRYKQGMDARAAREGAKPEPEKPKQKAEVVQLRIWPEAVRGVPNSFLRSALFAAVQGKSRHYLKGQILASTQGVTLKFTGMQLDQSDLDVWEQAVHLARLHPLGAECHFKGNAFLRAISRSTGKADYQWLDDVIDRLRACAVVVKSGSREYVGGLLQNAWRDKDTREYKLILDPNIIRLFYGDDWTGLEFEERRALKGKPLALWLHGFYSTHAAPIPYKVETLHGLCGSTTKSIRKFKQNLKIAFTDLAQLTTISGEITGDLVQVTRSPSAAQAKHIKKNSPRKLTRKPRR
jgi:hypothetical protein